MADSINNKAKEYYDNDDTGGSLNNNLKDFLKQQGAEGNSLNTLWRNYAYGEGGNSLNTRLGKLWGTSGSLIKRWKDVLGLTWDDLKLFFNARRNDPELLLSGATSFDGSDDYISFPFQESGNYTISAWFKLDVVQTSIVVNWGDQATGERRSLLIWNGGSGGYKVYSSTYGSNIASSTVLSAGVWYHASVTVDVSDGSAKIYLNGSLDGSGTNTINSFTGTTGEIGRQPGGEYFEGSLANVGIWNRALSSSEIESIYWKGQYADLKGTELTNLVSWYNLKSTSLGSDLVTNGDFATDSNWTKNTGWSIANGLASCDGSQSGASFLFQDIGLVAGRKYKITFDLSNHSAGSVRVRAGSSATSEGVSGYYNANSSIEVELFGSGSGAIFFFEATTSFTGSIDNVVVKEIQAPDAQGDNEGSIYGATTLTDAYSASSPFLPRIQDKASDTVANYGEVYGGTVGNFDGTLDFVELSNSTFMNGASAFTISVWALHDNTGSDVIFTTDTELLLGYSSGKVVASYRETDNTRNKKITTNAVDSGKWYHIVATWDKATDGEIKLYINGDYVAQSYEDGGASTANVLKDASTAIIGAWTNGGLAMDGLVSHLKILNVSVTQDQARELYIKPELTLPTGIASSALTLNMPFTEGSGTHVFDGSSNKITGTATGMTWATGQEYGFQHPLVRSNNPMVFDGSNDYVDTGSSFQSTFRNSFSVSMWVKPDDGQPSAESSFFGTRNSTSQDWIQSNLHTDGKVSFFYRSDNDTAEAKTSSAVFANGVTSWTHITYVADDSDDQLKIYVNGSIVSVTNGGLGSITMADWTSSDELFIGARDNNGTAEKFFDGMINDVSIWSSALTANEVTALYNSGLPLLPTADSGNYASSDDLVGYWRNDGVTTWLDRSTNSNNGTVSGSPASIIVPEGLNEGRDSQGYYLTDTDSISSGIRFKGAEYISVQDSESLDFGTSDFSIALWVKPNENIGATRGLIYKGADGSDEGYYLRVDSTKKIRWKLNDGSTDVSDLTTQTISQDVWTYITFVADRSGNGQIYLNGVLDSDSVSSISSVGDITSTENLYIGQYNTTSEFNGSIDEVKIYDKALSATEILKNYNNGKSAH